jgi:hypothetical protein
MQMLLCTADNYGTVSAAKTEQVTTNVCEGYHSVINAHFKQRHPDPYGFIVFLQQQDVMLERRIAKLQVGAPPKKKKS